MISADNSVPSSAFPPASLPSETSHNVVTDWVDLNWLGAYERIDDTDPAMAFTHYRLVPKEAAVETHTAQIAPGEKYSATRLRHVANTSAPDAPSDVTERQALADLRVGTGKYAELPLIRNILQRWQTTGPSPEVRTAYKNWVVSGSLELLLDALVAEMQLDGTWFRLALNDITAKSVQEWTSETAAGVPHRHNFRTDRQACIALSDWGALDTVDDRALEKRKRFIKVMASAFRKMDDRELGDDSTGMNFAVRSIFCQYVAADNA